ncbi:MAG: deacylase [Nitrospiraceae bacterium]|nr:deacylase [Nitrospiraceae bacterium]
MPVHKLKDFLDNHHVRYTSIMHPQTFTAQKTAQVTHIKGREMAKTIIVKTDGRLCMVVLPADRHVSLSKLKAATGAHAIELASEDTFRSLFPECEVGAMPPFGNLYGMEVFEEQELTRDSEIAFNAGSHTEVIRMAYKDYERLVQPTAGDFAI